MPDTSRFYNADQGPQAQPDVELPRRARQDVSASPSEFGGLEATGLKEAGTGATQAGEFFGQVAADQATNNFLDEATKIRGDFSNLRGQDAMNAWPGVQKQITDAFDRNRANLTLGSQEYYDRFSRRELVNNQDYMLNHYNQQQNEWQKTTNISTDATSNTAIASNPSDDHAFELNQQRMVDAAVKNAQHENGIDPSKPMTPDAQNIVNTASQDAKQRAILTRIQGVETTNPGLALSYLNKYRSDLGTKAPAVEERLKGYQKNAEDDAYIKHQYAAANGGGGAPTSTTGESNDPGASLIRSREGFAPSAYWDVNHYRAGYGSDTVTRPDGSVVAVTGSTVVTRDDAERDLSRRVGETQAKVAAQVGYSQWQGLSDGAKSALTSMGYNYGLLPWDVTAAIRGGAGPDVIARTIEGHAGDNGGVNRQRRMQEASIVLGAPVPAGGALGATGNAPPAEGSYIPSSVPSASPAAYQPPGAAPPPAFGQGAPAGAPSISGASAPAGAGAAPDSAAPTANRPIPAVMRAGGDQPPQTPWEKDRDTTSKAMIATMNDPTLDDETKDRRLGKLERRQRFAEYMIEQDSASRVKISNSVLDNALGKTLNGDAAGAYHDVDGAFRSGQIDARTYDAAQRVIQERSGSPNLAQYGPDYTKSLNDVLAKPGTPGRINNLTDLLQREAAGGLSPTGYAKLREAFTDAQSPEKQGVLEAKSATLNRVKQYMWYGEEGNSPGALKDPKGQVAFDKFVVSFESKYNKWTEAGKDPFEFLGDDKSILALADTIRSPEQKRLDQITESIGSEGKAYNPAIEQAQAPPAPQKVTLDTWKRVIDGRPTMQTNAGVHQIPRDAWGTFLTDLLSKPADLQQTVLKDFAQRFPGQDLETPFARLLADTQVTVEPPETPAEPLAHPVTPTPRGPPAHPETRTPVEPLVKIGGFHPENILSPDLAHDIEVTKRKLTPGEPQQDPGLEQRRRIYDATHQIPPEKR